MTTAHLPEWPHEITVDQLRAVLDALGLDPTTTAAINITAERVTVTSTLSRVPRDERPESGILQRRTPGTKPPITTTVEIGVRDPHNPFGDGVMPA